MSARECQQKFGNCKLSPLHHKGKNQNAVHRQNVGRMMKYVMAQFGYALLPRPENLTLNMA